MYEIFSSTMYRRLLFNSDDSISVRRWVESFTLLSSDPCIIHPHSSCLKLCPLDALSPSRNHDASNHLSGNAHAYSVRQNTRHVSFSTREVYDKSCRVYALYNRNKIILYCLSTSLLLQTVAGLWQYTVRGGKR
jgi:hypothetical protein